MTRHLVTGCAGFIGSHLAEALIDAGHEVVGVDAFTDYYGRDRKQANLERLADEPHFRLVEADLASTPLEPLLEGVGGIFHLAGQPGVRQSWGDDFATYLRDNIRATQRVFEAAVARDVRVVFASSSSIYGDAEHYPTREDMPPRPLSPYGVSKLACEHLAHSYAAVHDLDAISLRYFSVYGPRQRPDMAFDRIASCLLEGRTFRLMGSGHQVRDFTYVDDVVDATMTAMERGGGGATYNVGGGSPTSLRDAISLCESICGRRLRIDRCPTATGDPPRTAADTSRIAADTGWQPHTSLEGGLAAQLAWRSARTPQPVGT